MSTTLAFRFPLGRYHANPWNRAVNEGATEWPPSPWRILRALVSTWYYRWPDLPTATLDGLLEALSVPPFYLTPPAEPGHTRHYMPNLEYKRGLSDGKKKRPKPDENDPSGKELTLDPFLAIAPEAELLVRWDTDLDASQRQVLAKLAELLPYLGRSESLCEARLLDEDPAPDERWWRPGPGERRLLTVTSPVSREILEATTTEIRRSRRMVPPGTDWMTYTPPVAELPSRTAVPDEHRVTAVRFAVMGPVPVRATHGVLLADRVHKLASKELDRAKIPDPRRREILGTRGAATDHGHAHWIPLPDSGERGGVVRHLVAWVPKALGTGEVRALLNVDTVSGQLGEYKVSGLPKVTLLFQAAGTVEQVAPELCRSSSTWRSLTPYLPVRHKKRGQSLDEYIEADIATELRYRDLQPASVTRVNTSPVLTDRWALDFRRYRLNEDLSRARPGAGLLLRFSEPVAGPMLMGQLSHFGFGIFEPVD